MLNQGNDVPIVFVRDSFYWDAKTVAGRIVRYNDEMFQSMMWYALYALWSGHEKFAEQMAARMREVDETGESTLTRKWREIALLLNVFVYIQQGKNEEAITLLKKNGRFSAESVNEVLKEKTYWAPLLQLAPEELSPLFWKKQKALIPPNRPYGGKEAYPDMKGQFPKKEKGLERWFQQLQKEIKQPAE